MSYRNQSADQSTSQTRISVPVAAIYVDPANNLRMFPANDQKLEELKASIQEQGLVNPLVVRLPDELADSETEKQSGYILVAGFQRFRAVQALGWESVDVTLSEVADGHLLNIDENVVRNTLSPMDEAFVCSKLKQGGMTGRDIAKRMHQSGAWVTGRQKLMGLRPHIQQMIHEGKLDGTFAARELAMQSVEDQDKVLAGMSEAAAAGNVSKVREVKAKASKEGKEKRRAAAAKAGKKVKGRKAKPVKVAVAKKSATSNGHAPTKMGRSTVDAALGLYPVEEWTLTPKEVLAVKVLTVVATAKNPKALWAGVVKAL